MSNTDIMVAENATKLVTESDSKLAAENIYSSTDAFNNLFKIASVISKTQLVPDNYRNRPEDCTIAIDIANRNGMSPLSVMQNLYVVKGKPTWSGQACIAMLKASPEFEHVKPVMVGGKNDDSFGCYFKAIDKYDGETIKGPLVTVKMAKDEGWYSKAGSKWQTMPELMLQYRAAAFFARIHMPNALMGYKVEGEPEDIAKTVRTQTTNPFTSPVEMDEKTLKEAEEIFE